MTSSLSSTHSLLPLEARIGPEGVHLEWDESLGSLIASVPDSVLSVLSDGEQGAVRRQYPVGFLACEADPATMRASKTISAVA